MAYETFEEKIERLTKKEPASFTESEILFLRARSGHLTEEQLVEYESVLVDQPEEVILLDLKRSELDEMAIELGLDPVEYSNKEKIATAIEEAQAEPEEEK